VLYKITFRNIPANELQYDNLHYSSVSISVTNEIRSNWRHSV